MWFLNTDVNHRYQTATLFSVDECQKIISLFKESLIDATTETQNKNSVRKGKVHWVDVNESTAWIYERCSIAVRGMNSDLFKFDLQYIEKLQFTAYDEPDAKYGKHLDTLHISGAPRKLSFSVQLSDSSSYEGCELLLHNASKPTIADRQVGTMTIFPSYTLHEVTPLQSGVRYSLVGWVVGPSFR